MPGGCQDGARYWGVTEDMGNKQGHPDDRPRCIIVYQAISKMHEAISKFHQATEGPPPCEAERVGDGREVQAIAKELKAF